MIDDDARLAELEADRRRSNARDRQIVAFALGLLILVILVVYVPNLLPNEANGLVSDRAQGVIVALQPASDEAGPTATVRVLDGADAGQTASATIEGPSGFLDLPHYRVGDQVVVAIDVNPDGSQDLSVVDLWRLPLLEWILIAFGVLTVVVAGWRGLRALTSLAITIVLVIRVLIPLLLSGWNAVGLAIGLGIAITILSFLFTQGFGRATFAAILGTAGGLVITGLLAVFISQAARFTVAQGSQEIVALEQLGPGGAEGGGPGGPGSGGPGSSVGPAQSVGPGQSAAPGQSVGPTASAGPLASVAPAGSSSAAATVSAPPSGGPQGSSAPVQGGSGGSGSSRSAPGIDLSGLVLAGVIFGSLGVLNDVAISQAVTVEELREVDPDLSRRDLYSRTMRIGIAHLAANVNTLVFAYLGAGLPLLVLLAVQVRNLGATVNEEFVAAEIVRAVVGSIGVLAAVPLTTALATFLAGASASESSPGRVGDGHFGAGST